MPEISPQALTEFDDKAARQRVEDNAFQLGRYRSAHERTSAQRKSPRQMRRATDADAFVCHNIESRA